MVNLQYVRTRFLDLWAKKDIAGADHDLFDKVITFAQLVEDTVKDPDLTDYAQIQIIKDELYGKGKH